MSDLLPFPSGHRHEVCEFDISELVHEVCESLETRGFERGVFLDVDVPPYIMMCGDRRQLRQLVQRLVSNALEITPRGGSVVVTAFSDDAEIELEVADSGSVLRGDIGGRVGSTPLPSGWTDIQRIVASHGGHIQVEECPDGGVAFTVHFPRDLDGDAAAWRAA